MKLMRWSGLPERTGFLPDVFDDFFSNKDFDFPSKMTPAVDVSEKEDRYIVKADLPGMKQEEIKVNLEDNVLTISGERKEEKEEKDEKKRYHYYERSYGSFARSFTLPNTVKTEEIKAKYEKGVLHIEIPKAEAKKPKEIKVE